MIVVLSGEGPSDLGQCKNAQPQCRADDFSAGPMAVVVDRVVESEMGYSVFDIPEGYRYVSESGLAERADARKRLKKGQVSFKGKKRGEETGYFYVNAWMLGEIAADCEVEANDQAVAVLFRDCDGTHSTPATDWQAKWNSMMQGFRRAPFERGVPMLPKPKSEAWLLCAAKTNAYQNCDDLEDSLSGNDASPNSAKSRLAELIDDTSSTGLRSWVEESVDVDRIDMPSFNHFKGRLVEVLESL